jgi:transcription elongation factor GreA
LRPARGKNSLNEEMLRSLPRDAALSQQDYCCWGCLRCLQSFPYNEDRAVAGILSMSADVVKKLQDEIQALEYELNFELPKELQRARALGDLSENAEFHMAKQRQDYVGARLVHLKKRLADLSLINFNNIPKDRVAFGSKVTLYDLDRDQEIEYKLVTTEEADLSRGLISTSSPIGRGLMGKRVGDSVKVSTPSGSREFEIRALQTIHDEVA